MNKPGGINLDELLTSQIFGLVRWVVKLIHPETSVASMKFEADRYVVIAKKFAIAAKMTKEVVAVEDAMLSKAND
jgi:hypothetical protein